MAHRTFVDRDGTVWTVWEVHPQYAERRSVERRVAAGPPPRGVAERRKGSERRQMRKTRAVLAADMSGGWLTCESALGEKRRFAPVPPKWESLSDNALGALCRAARLVGPGGRSKRA